MALDSYHFPTLLKLNYERWGDKKVAVRQKEFGIWQKYTWEHCYRQIKWRSLGMISLGLNRGDSVSIIGDNEPQWLWFQAAVQAAGGVPVGMFADSMPAEVKYLVDHSDSKFVVARDQEQVDKMLEIKDELTQLKRVIYWDPDGMRNYRDRLLISEEEVLKLGKAHERENPGAFEEEIAKGSEADLAGLFCTSGTTSMPKLAKFPYRSLARQAEALNQLGVVGKKDNLIAFFPPGLTSTDLFGAISHVVSGVSMNYPEQPETAMADLREISPEVIILGPRHYEGLVRLIQVKIADAGIVQRTFYRLFLPVGYKMADLRLINKRPNLFWRALYGIAWFLVLRPILDSIGLLKTRVAIGGSALLSPETYRLLLALGVNLRTIYGSAETGVVTLHREDDIRPETAGPPLPGMEIRIDDKGEVLIGGGYILTGYHKDPEAEAASIKEGWFHSGDAGYMNDDGHLIIIDRMKELGELESGFTFSPQYIESRLRFSPFIKDAMIVGDKREHVSALLNIDPDNVGNWAEKHHISYTTFVDLSQKEEIAELVKQDLLRLNRLMPEHSRMTKYVVLHKEFDVDEAELTRTRKLRRTFMEDKYGDLIEAIYSDREEIPIETAVTYRDGRTGTVKTTLKIRNLTTD